MRRCDVVGEWSLEVKILVHHWRMVGVLGRSWIDVREECFVLQTRRQSSKVRGTGRDPRLLERLTLRMYGFVGWNDLGTMVARERTSSKVA